MCLPIKTHPLVELRLRFPNRWATLNQILVSTGVVKFLFSIVWVFG